MDCSLAALRAFVAVSSLSLVLGAMASLSACDSGVVATQSDESGGASGDESSPPPGSQPEGLSFARDVQPILDASCVAACHEAGGSGLPLLLRASASVDPYDQLVDVQSRQAAAQVLVEPGNATESYLVRKLEGSQLSAGGAGQNMPPGGPLSGSQLQTIRDWVDAGALR